MRGKKRDDELKNVESTGCFRVKVYCVKKKANIAECLSAAPLFPNVYTVPEHNASFL